MGRNTSASSISPRTEPGQFLLRRILPLLLLLAVPAFTTQARTNWYLPQSNPGHYLTAASKVVVPPPVAISNAQAEVVIRVLWVMPETRMARPAEPEPRTQFVELITPLRHRPPPAFSL
jgi:hypothetical protein